jgi:hypothetical protein
VSGEIGHCVCVPHEDAESPDLVRYWFEFDVFDLRPPPPAPGTVSLDGGTVAYRFCWRGVGATGYDERDCLELIAQAISPEGLPPVSKSLRNVDVSALPITTSEVGVPAWRGIWFPRINLRGPDLG